MLSWAAVNDRVPVFVRLPREQATQLDRLVVSTGRRKQELVSELLSDQLVVGRAEVADPAAAEVLTLEEAAALLRVTPASLLERARRGELPGRRLGEEWRFARSALLAWVGEMESSGATDAGSG